MSNQKQEVDINVTIRLDEQLKKKEAVSEDMAKGYEKITTPLSVAQLAYIFRVFTETGTIKTDNLSDLFRFVSEHISTIRKEEISPDSFRNKFYKPSEAAKQSVLDLFVKQVSYIRKDSKKVV